MSKIIITLLIAGLFVSCSKKNNQECGELICTDNFASIVIQFQDNKGVAASTKDFQVVNLRTNERIYATSSTTVNLSKGFFIVADDGIRKMFSTEGDNLKITGTSGETNQTKSEIIKVSGGECSCHVNKISGPDIIKFD